MSNDSALLYPTGYSLVYRWHALIRRHRLRVPTIRSRLFCFRKAVALPHDHFSAHTFDPETLRVLYRAFDAAWKAVAPQTPAADHARVRDAIAQAVVALAQSGQLAPNVLEVYATEQALAAAGLSAGRPSYSLPLLH